MMPSRVSSSPREVLQFLESGKAGKCRQGSLGSPLRCGASRRTSSEGLCFDEVSQWSQSLERLLKSNCGMQIFQAFLKSEFSDENIEFWLVCEEYKRIKSSFRMSSRAKKIFKRYIEANAPREINIDHKTREAVKRNIQAANRMSFDDAQNIVYSLMEKDSYPRFIRSDLFRVLLESNTVKM